MSSLAKNAQRPPVYKQPALIMGLVFLLALALPLFNTSVTVTDFIVRLAAFGILATSLNMLIGYGGMISFGHAMFYSAGAYAYGVSMQQFGFAVPLGMIFALVFSAILAFLIGILCVKSREIYFSILTLAFAMLVYSVIESWTPVTGGDQGLMGGIPRPIFLGIDLGDRSHLYWFTCVLAFVSLVLLRYLIDSPFGYTLRMVRDNADRARFLGINVFRVRLLAFTISGIFGSVSGIIMAMFLSGAYPSMAYWTTSGEAIFMIMIGGVGVFFGPLLGAAFLLLFNDLIVRETTLHGLALGLIILFVALIFKQGLLGFIFQRR